MTKLIVAGLVLTLLTACAPKAERPAPTDSLPAAAPQTTTDTAPAPTAVAPSRPDSSPASPAASAVTPASPVPAKPPRSSAAAPKPSAQSAGSAPTTAPAAPAPAPAVAAGQDPYHPAARDTLDSETYQGWKQFELNCSRCHGEYAVGTTFAPALVVSLKEGGTIPTKELFITTVCAGRLDKGMPSWCALGLEMGKIEQIYLYVKGRADGEIAAGRPAQRP
jgi:mono/diheme cytochrome c family protein